VKAEIEEAVFKADVKRKEPFALPSRLAIALEKAGDPVRAWISAQFESILSEIPFKEQILQRNVVREVTEPKSNCLLTVEEASKILNISVRWIYRHSKDIPHKRIGKYIRFSEKDLIKWAEKRSGEK
jgi:excisionase family DNA binding protein